MNTPAANVSGAAEARHIVPLALDVASAYPDNTVINSRYTAVNFIFKNLYEQFRRPLNFYFLLVAMLQFISIIAPVNPMSTLLPLMFAFSLTAMKEGYDDVKRHRHDAAYNKTARLVLDRVSGQWVPRCNAEIRVGDVILLHQGEEFPCDCVVIAAPSSSVFIRTDNLDGEIDLKPRDVIAPPVDPASVPVEQLGAEDTDSEMFENVSTSPTAQNAARQPFFNVNDTGATLLEKLSCLALRCPPPSSIIESFDGVASFTPLDFSSSPLRLLCSRTASHGKLLSPVTSSVGGTGTPPDSAHADDVIRVSLSHRHLAPQSCLLKNTEKAICVAVYTGNDTKCGMNKRPPPVKWAKIDKDVSKYSIFIFCCQLLSALSFGIVGYVKNVHVHETAWYLPQTHSERARSFLIYPLRFFLLTTVMIPVSFKFVVDMSKYYMAMVVEWDQAMTHSESGLPDTNCKVNNSSILEDLGQIDYVLSDKTGTMTQNVMELNCISVVPDFQVDVSKLTVPANICGSPTSVHEARRDANPQLTSLFPSSSTSLQGTEVLHFASMLALCNTVEVTAEPQGSAKGKKAADASMLPPASVSYLAASPDEVALCCGAAKLSVTLCRRTLHKSWLQYSTPDQPDARCDEWILHHVFPFSSERKAMGVIVENARSKRMLLVVKGADDSLTQMLRGGTAPTADDGKTDDTRQPTWQQDYPVMAEHLSAYAKRGLRTLLVAQREVSPDELSDFLKRHAEAELAMENRQESIDKLRTAMEANLQLIGITAIEDKLQENVKETMEDILDAGVKLWMLTGDKVETAEQIGLSCGLYRPTTRVLRVVEGSTRETRDDWEHKLMSMSRSHHSASAAKPVTKKEHRPSTQVRRRGLFPVHYSDILRRRGQRLIDSVRYFELRPPESFHDHFGEAFSDAEAMGDAQDTAHAGEHDSGAQTSVCDVSATDSCVLIVQGGHVLDRILSSPLLLERFTQLSSKCVSVICARTTPNQKAQITQFVRSQGYMTLSIGDGGNDVAMIQEAHVGVGIVGREGQQAARAADFAITQFSDLRQLLFVHGQQAYARTAYVIKYSFYKSMLISFIQLAYNVVGVHFSGGTFWNSFSLTMWNGVYTLPQTLFYSLDRLAPRVVLERCPALYKRTRQGADMDIGEFFGWYVARGVLQSITMLYLVTHVFGVSFDFPSEGYAASNDVVFSTAYTALILSQMFTVFLESHSVTALNLLWIVGMPVFYIVTTLAYSDVSKLQYYGVLRKTLVPACVLTAFGIAVALTIPILLLLVGREEKMPSTRDVLRSAELKRQAGLLRQKEYRTHMSWWVRWLKFTPEAPSPSLAQTAVRGSSSKSSGPVVHNDDHTVNGYV